MKESQYQKKISDKLEKEGYYVIKLIKTNKNGIPDLIAIKENNTILWNGIFGSKKQTHLMIEWKNNLRNILNQKKNKIAWSEVGCQMLQSMYNKNPSLYNDYKINNKSNSYHYRKHTGRTK